MQLQPKPQPSRAQQVWRSAAIVTVVAASLGATLLLYAQPGFVFDLANRWIMCF